MNEVDLRKYIDRITEAVVILTKRIEVLEKNRMRQIQERIPEVIRARLYL